MRRNNSWKRILAINRIRKFGRQNHKRVQTHFRVEEPVYNTSYCDEHRRKQSVFKKSNTVLKSMDRSKDCWAVFYEAVLTTKQIQLLQRGADWMTQLGGVQSKVNMMCIFIYCNPNQGAVASNGWHVTTSGIAAYPFTGKLTKLCNPWWKCPFCGHQYKLTNGARVLTLDDRNHPDDT